MSVVGWYIHHHGAGHLTRFLAVRPSLGHDVVVFSSLPEPSRLPDRTTWIVLPRDDDAVVAEDGTVRSPADAAPTARGRLHWAPIGHAGHTARLATIARVATIERLAAFVVDVSVEVAVFVRLLGVPIVVVTQPGDRSDAPHGRAYELADRILAPWAVDVHESPALSPFADRIAHVGGISRFENRRWDTSAQPGRVVVLGGGTPRARDLVAAARRATPGTTWILVGADRESWVEDPWALLREAEVVVTAAGQNSVADLAAAGARAVVIPQERPFGEQAATGARLAERSLAVVLDEWPDAEEWPYILDRARALAPAWDQWGVSGAARRAATVIDDVIAATS